MFTNIVEQNLRSRWMSRSSTCGHELKLGRGDLFFLASIQTRLFYLAGLDIRQRMEVHET